MQKDRLNDLMDDLRTRIDDAAMEDLEEAEQTQTGKIVAALEAWLSEPAGESDKYDEPLWMEGFRAAIQVIRNNWAYIEQH